MNDLSVIDNRIRTSGSNEDKKGWEERLIRADQQINTSGFVSGTQITGLERTALRQFLALDSKDSSAAAQIARDALLPASGNKVTPYIAADSNKGLRPSGDAIYNQDAADTARQKAEAPVSHTVPTIPAATRSPGFAPDSKPEIAQVRQWLNDRRGHHVDGGTSSVTEKARGGTEYSPQSAPDSQTFIRSKISKVMPELSGEDNTSPGHPIRRLEIEQADRVGDLLNKTDLGENARGHYTPAAADNLKGVGKVLDKEVVEPGQKALDYIVISIK